MNSPKPLPLRARLILWAGAVTSLLGLYYAVDIAMICGWMAMTGEYAGVLNDRYGITEDSILVRLILR